MNLTDLKLFFRNQKSSKIFTLINIFGFAIGMAACVLIAIYIRHELSYDRFHHNASRIVRVNTFAELGKQVLTLPTTSPPVAPALTRDMDVVENFTRFLFQKAEIPVRYKTTTLMENMVCWADSTIFDVFDFQLIAGDPKTALTLPGSVVITASMAKKYFGDADPLGEHLIINRTDSVMVKGVMLDPAQPTHMPDFSYLISFVSLGTSDESSWLGNNGFPTYLLLKEGVDWATLQPELDAAVERYEGERLASIKGDYRLGVQPLLDIHLKSDFNFELLNTETATYVNHFIAIGLFILLIACLNYINLSTARSSGRCRQVGISKVVGSTRSRLMGQFLLESVFTALAAILMALFIVKAALPYFTEISGRDFDFSFHDELPFLAVVVIISLVTGLLAGLYPALYLSGFKPAEVLKGHTKSGVKGSKLRAILVVLQFTISIVLIICTLVIQRQMRFMQDKNLGYNTDQMLAISVVDRELRADYKTHLSEIESITGVESATSSLSIPNMAYGQSVLHIPGAVAEDQLIIWLMMVKENYIKNMGMKIIEGRDFDPEMTTDYEDAIIINQAALREMGWENAVGKQLEAFQSLDPPAYKPLNIIGVVEDFHFESFRQKIRPVFFRMLPVDPVYLIFKLNPENLQETMAQIETKWRELAPEIPLNYQFLDDAFDEQYRAEIRMGKLFNYFTIFAIVIACLGLFALASYSAEQRTREIGIRKVLGASVSGIVQLLSKEFIFLVLISNIIAAPIAFYLMKSWLNGFAYRTMIHPRVFINALLLSIFIALLTVSFQAIRAATMNPVNSIKYE